MPKAKAVKAAIKDKRVKAALEKAKLGAAAVSLEKATDIIDNPYLNAAEGALIGGAVAGVPGAIAGGAIGYLIGDQYITFPMPMIAIPAHEAYLLTRNPSMQVYIRAGETLVPTGGNVMDVQLGEAQAFAMEAEETSKATTKRKPTAYQKKYKKAFAQVKPKFMKKDGTWKKNGFKAAVKSAHRRAKQ